MIFLTILFFILGFGLLWMAFLPEARFRKEFDYTNEEKKTLEKKTLLDYLLILLTPQLVVEAIFGRMMDWLIKVFPFWVTRSALIFLALILFFIGLLFIT